VIRGLLSDIHGVLYTHPRALPGSVDAVARLRAAGMPLVFVTNSTQFPKRHILGTLREAGVDLDPAQVLTSPEAAGAVLAAHGHRRVGWLCAPELAEDVPGVEPVRPGAAGRVDAVLVGDLREGFTFPVLNQAFRWLHDGAALVALARARFYQGPEGLLLDCGPFVALLEDAAQVAATVVGKPAPAFFAAALDRLGVPASDAAMIGDDLDFDVLPAMDLGLCGVLVKTGKYREDRYAAAARKPDRVAADLAEAADWVLGGAG